MLSGAFTPTSLPLSWDSVLMWDFGMVKITARPAA